jgi:hypothetical protein
VLTHPDSLIESDFVGGDVVVDTFASRAASNDGGVVFNNIPEPSVLGLMFLAGVLLKGLRRLRRHVG